MIILNLFQLLLLVPLCLAVPPPAAPPVGKVDPKLADAGVRPTDYPINKAYTDAVLVDYTKPAPALLKEIAQTQKVADMKANSNMLESVSGGFWGKDTGKTPTGKVEVPAKPKTPTAPPPALLKRGVPKTLTPCLDRYKIGYVISKDKIYKQYATPYNQRNKVLADVIVIARDIQNVADAVFCAQRSDVITQARSGGHSYAAFSSGDALKGGMVIDPTVLGQVYV
jgi:hypothetical protein